MSGHHLPLPQVLDVGVPQQKAGGLGSFHYCHCLSFPQATLGSHLGTDCMADRTLLGQWQAAFISPRAAPPWVMYEHHRGLYSVMGSAASSPAGLAKDKSIKPPSSLQQSRAEQSSVATKADTAHLGSSFGF